MWRHNRYKVILYSRSLKGKDSSYTREIDRQHILNNFKTISNSNFPNISIIFPTCKSASCGYSCLRFFVCELLKISESFIGTPPSKEKYLNKHKIILSIYLDFQFVGNATKAFCRNRANRYHLVSERVAIDYYFEVPPSSRSEDAISSFKRFQFSSVARSRCISAREHRSDIARQICLLF